MNIAIKCLVVFCRCVTSIAFSQLKQLLKMIDVVYGSYWYFLLCMGPGAVSKTLCTQLIIFIQKTKKTV